MKEFEKYLIFTNLKDAVEFQNKLKEQNIEYFVKLGDYPEPWIKISYADGYKPF